MSGSIPFFIGLENLPNRTMTTFPKALVASAMALPGVPSQAEVLKSMAAGEVPQVNLDQFDMMAYMTIHKQLMEYAGQNLLTTSKASKVVPEKDVQRVLIHSRTPEVGYGQFMLVNGLLTWQPESLCLFLINLMCHVQGLNQKSGCVFRENSKPYNAGPKPLFPCFGRERLVNNGHSVCARPEEMLRTMRDDYTGALDTAYGRGFSYARTVDHTKLALDCHGPWDYYLLLAEGGDTYPEPDVEDTKQAKHILAINWDDMKDALLPAPSVATEYFVRELV